MGKKTCAIVYNVLPDSIAEEVEISKGDKILTINGQEIIDIFDYKFNITNEELLLEIGKPDGEIWEVEIEKEEYEDLGIEFENDLIDKAKSCHNKCIFCFIDQLPPDMRKTVYFKDDDPRLSFLTGNYVTLTNTSYSDLDRLIKYRMTPVNVSVHATDEKLRAFMMGNKNTDDVVDKIKKLVSNGIEVNCQIVLMRDVNDKANLDKTIEDLYNISPKVRSISVVPVGISKYRDKLFKVKPFDQASSLEVVKQIEKWQEVFLDKYGSRVVFMGDEFYLMAKIEVPEIEKYEDFPQIENGVGLIAQFKYEFFKYLNEIQNLEYKFEKEVNVDIATGTLVHDFILELANELKKVNPKVKINVHKILNNFFGQDVTVAGLLTGKDIVEQLKDKELGENIYLSESMLRTGESVFLDDYRISDLESKLMRKIVIVENNGKDFISKIFQIESQGGTKN